MTAQRLQQITSEQTAEMSIGLVQAIRGNLSNDRAGELIASYINEMLEGRPLEELTLGDVVVLTQSMARLWSALAALAANLTDPDVAREIQERGPTEVIQQLALRLLGGK